MISLAALCAHPRSEASEAAQVTNPISRIARVFDPQLVKVEDRVDWLDRQLSSCAKRCEYPLKTGVTDHFKMHHL